MTSWESWHIPTTTLSTSRRQLQSSRSLAVRRITSRRLLKYLLQSIRESWAWESISSLLTSLARIKLLSYCMRWLMVSCLTSTSWRRLKKAQASKLILMSSAGDPCLSSPFKLYRPDSKRLMLLVASRRSTMLRLLPTIYNSSESRLIGNRAKIR